MSLRERLRQLRRERGWTQEELASRCGNRTSTVGGWEAEIRGITLTNLRALAAAFGLTLSEFLEGVE